jgi:hypothetical protein
MQRLLSFVFSILLLASARAQTDDRQGTVHVKKTGETKSVPPQNPAAAVQRLKTFVFRRSGHSYKISFPDNYKADLYPLVFDGDGGIVLTDASKKMTDNVFLKFDYELYKGNVFAVKRTEIYYSSGLLQEMMLMPPGSSAWISNLVYKDKDGRSHFNEISTFKIEKLN